ncbi:hypothetical protein [Mesorhizobium loti]|nr:hypothetical protein [Mesorhizobium loti]
MLTEEVLVDNRGIEEIIGDMLGVGAGASGVAAAVTAPRAGLSVI